MALQSHFLRDYGPKDSADYSRLAQARPTALVRVEFFYFFYAFPFNFNYSNLREGTQEESPGVCVEQITRLPCQVGA